MNHTLLSMAIIRPGNPGNPPAQIDLLTPAMQQKLIPAVTPGNEQIVSSALIAPWIGTILRAVMIVGVISVLIFLLWGSIEWISSGGDKSKVEEARNKITGAITGLLMLAASIAIFSAIQVVFGIHILSFS